MILYICRVTPVLCTMCCFIMESILWNWQVTFLQKKKKLVYLHLQFEDSPLGFFFFFYKGKGKGKSEVIKKVSRRDLMTFMCESHQKHHCIKDQREGFSGI